MTPLTDSARRALEEYGDSTGSPPSAPELAEAWQGAVRRVEAPPPVWSGRLGFAVGLAVGALLVGTLMTVTRAGSVASLEPLPGARFTQAEGVVRLESGSLRIVARAEPVRVSTPELSTAMLDSKALVEVTGEGTALSVVEGSVVYRDGDGEHVVARGARVVVPPALRLAAGQQVPGCASGGADFEPCLEAAARGDGLAAQTALYEWGVHAHEEGRAVEAIDRFRQYQRRFPDGALAPEVSIAVMLELRALGQVTEARAEASRFVRQFPAEPSRSSVERWSQQLTK